MEGLYQNSNLILFSSYHMDEKYIFGQNRCSGLDQTLERLSELQENTFFLFKSTSKRIFQHRKLNIDFILITINSLYYSRPVLKEQCRVKSSGVLGSRKQTLSRGGTPHPPPSQLIYFSYLSSAITHCQPFIIFPKQPLGQIAFFNIYVNIERVLSCALENSIHELNT